MKKKNVYVSFDYNNEEHYKFVLNAWNEHMECDFSYNDMPSEKISSNNILKLKDELTLKISKCTYVLVIVSEDSNKEDLNSGLIGYKNWQNWEVAKAKELNKKIVGTKVNSMFEPPEELIGSCTSWARKFNQSFIASSFIDV